MWPQIYIAAVLAVAYLCSLTSDQSMVECGAAAGMHQMTGGTATLGLAATTRSAMMMNLAKRPNLDMGAGARGLQRLTNNIKLNSAGAYNMSPLEMKGSSAMGDALTMNFDMEQEVEDWELEELANLNDIAPPDCYANLIKRSKQLNNKIKNLKQNSAGNSTISDMAQQLVDKAFSQASQALVEEECEPGTEMTGDGQSPNEVQAGDDLGRPNGHSDFIYKTLNKIVDQIDTAMFKWSDAEPFIKELIYGGDKEAEKTLDQKVSSLIRRMKDRAIDYAKKHLKIKATTLVHKKTIEIGSKFLVDQAGWPGDPMSYLWSMREAMNSDVLSRWWEMMDNLPFRGAISYINNQNPMPYMRCKPKRRQPEPYC